MPRRKKKRYNRPKKIFDKAVIQEEQDLIKKYGLKNRREVWKANFEIGKIRRIAKNLITADEKKKEDFVMRQKEKGFPVENLTDVLGLNKEDWLKRRLQNIVSKKGLASNPKQARQFITHRHVTINKRCINSPAHLTTLNEEKNIILTLERPQKKEITEEEEEILNKIHVREEKNE